MATRERTSKRVIMNDETLDFLSPEFNALKALYTTDLQPPVPNIQIFNNVAEYALAIKAGKTKSIEAIKTKGVKDSLPHSFSRTKNLKPEYKPAHTEDLQERLKAISESKASNIKDTKPENKRDVRMDGSKLQEFILVEEAFKAEQRKKKRMDVVQRMKALAEGPFSILQTCLTERCRVKVWTRRYKGLRSVLAGYLVAFDKHMNLALFDVDEVYTLEEEIKQEVKGESLEKREKKRKEKKRATPPLQKNTTDDPKTASTSLDEKETVGMEISSIPGISSATQAITDFQEVKPQVLLATECKNITPTESFINEEHSVCNFLMDTSGEESLVPSAKALCKALESSTIPFVEAEGSHLADAFEKCYVDIREEEEARCVKAENDCTEENVDKENPVLTVRSKMHFQNERMAYDENVKTGRMRSACVERNSVVNDRSSFVDEMSTQNGPVSQFELNIADLENYESITRPVEYWESSKHEATFKIAVSELVNSAEADNSLADKETSLLHSEVTSLVPCIEEGCETSERCKKVETHSSSSDTVETSQTYKVNYPFASTSTTIQLLTESLDVSVSPKEKAKGTSMALDVTTERCVKGRPNKQTLDEVSEDVDINQRFTEHAVASTQHDTLFGEGKSSDISSISLAVSSSSGEEVKASHSHSHCLSLDLNSDKVPEKREDKISLAGQTSCFKNREEIKCQINVSNKREHCDVQQRSSSPIQFNKAEVAQEFLALNRSNKPEGGESIYSQQSPVNNKRDTNTFSCGVKNLLEKSHGFGIASETVASNSTSEDYTNKTQGKEISPMKGAELTCDKNPGDEEGVALMYRTNESKSVDDKKEEGEISSSNGNTLRTQKEREEGELSSSDSDVETYGELSSHQQQSGIVGLSRSNLSGNRKQENSLCPTSQRSSSGLSQNLSNERGSNADHSGSVGRSFVSTKLRTKLSEAGKTQQLLKRRSRSISHTRGNCLGERPFERRIKRSGSVEKCSTKGVNENSHLQEKIVRNTAKDWNKTNNKGSTLHGGETRQRGNEGIQGKDKTKRNCRKSANKVNTKSNVSLRGGDTKVKKTDSISSRHKTKDPSEKYQLDHKKMTEKSSGLSATGYKKNTRKFRSLQGHQTIVKGKDLEINLELLVTKPTCSGEGENKKTVSRAMANAPSRVTKEEIRSNLLARTTNYP